jgi:hypothetical protein
MPNMGPIKSITLFVASRTSHTSFFAVAVPEPVMSHLILVMGYDLIFADLLILQRLSSDCTTLTLSCAESKPSNS